MKITVIGPKTFTEIAITFAKTVRKLGGEENENSMQIINRYIGICSRCYPAINFHGMFLNMSDKLMGRMFK